MTVLLREAIGDRLRRTRTVQRRTLREVSRAARVSLGYLSEVERGRKEASSELLASICEALELPIDELLVRVAGDVGPGFLPQVPDTVPDELVDGRAEACGDNRPAPASSGGPEGGRLVMTTGDAMSDLRVAAVRAPGAARSTAQRHMVGAAA
ncbi:MAG: helix-turn-helix domain-containing protein [Pseudonocardiaceae bacterium]|nr:helix-turn-helix domain-containing protein [Pseudonocardiaceae bacterium]